MERGNLSLQDYVWCYLNVVYSQLEYIVEISSQIVVEEFICFLNQQFPSDLKGEYLFEMQGERLLDLKLSFLENQVISGSYLYLL